MIKTRNRERHLDLYCLRDSIKLAVQLPQQINIFCAPVSADTKEFFRLRGLIAPGELIGAAQKKFVVLFGSAREAKSQAVGALGPSKRARIGARQQSFSAKQKCQRQAVNRKNNSFPKRNEIVNGLHR